MGPVLEELKVGKSGGKARLFKRRHGSKCSHKKGRTESPAQNGAVSGGETNSVAITNNTQISTTYTNRDLHVRHVPCGTQDSFGQSRSIATGCLNHWGEGRDRAGNSTPGLECSHSQTPCFFPTRFTGQSHASVPTFKEQCARDGVGGTQGCW